MIRYKHKDKQLLAILMCASIIFILTEHLYNRELDCFYAACRPRLLFSGSTKYKTEHPPAKSGIKRKHRRHDWDSYIYGDY